MAGGDEGSDDGQPGPGFVDLVGDLDGVEQREHRADDDHRPRDLAAATRPQPGGQDERDGDGRCDSDWAPDTWQPELTSAP